MTFTEIKNQLSEAGKPVADVQIYRYMRRLGIKSIGVKQIPRRYPDDSARKILAELGMSADIQISADAPTRTAKTILERTARPVGLVSMAVLRRARREARRGAR